MNRASDPARERAEILMELVGINSVNPLQAGPRSGPGGEQELALWLAERTGAAGAEVVLDEAEPGRPNVYAHFAGSGQTVGVDVHLDTVGVEHMTGDPFAGRIADNRVYGRGAVDSKATLAVLLPLLAELGAANRRDGPDLYLIGSVGEEAGGLVGAHRLCQWATNRGVRFQQLIVAEPTSCAPVHGHKGGVGLEITVKGAAAHSSKPELGQNAIVAAARIVEAFQRRHDELVAQPPTTAVGPGTLAVTEISGGLARNIIPDECQLYAGRRTVPGEDPDAVFAQLRALAERAAAPLAVEVALSYGRSSPAFFQDPTSALVTELSALAGEEPTTATYGSNALAYRSIADEISVFGPGSIDQAHTAVEWIEISELDRADQIYRRWLHLDPPTS
jgi:acetylornithine deacetylase/succinyl-diaminopimelate desuccinylase-like protein